MMQRWLSARDTATMRDAWRALAPRRHEISHPHRKITTQGAALLAAAMTGERADWLTTIDTTRYGAKPDHEWGGESGDRCFDDVLESSSLLNERWKLYERRAGERGERGVQLVVLEISETYPPYEGGVVRGVRIFDGERAASVALDSNRVSTVGDVDLAPLDLLDFSRGVPLALPDDDVATAPRLMATARGLIARLAARIDDGYAPGAQWPRVGDSDRPSWLGPARFAEEGRYGDGARSIDVVMQPDQVSKATAGVNGLPWGHSLKLDVQTWVQTNVQPNVRHTSGYLYVRLPNAHIDALLAHLDANA